MLAVSRLTRVGAQHLLRQVRKKRLELIGSGALESDMERQCEDSRNPNAREVVEVRKIPSHTGSA